MAKKISSKFLQFFSGNYNLLLCFLVILFICRPYSEDMIYHGIWKIFFTATLLSAIFNCDHNKYVKVAVFTLAIPSLVLTWIDLFYKNELVVSSFAFLTILFICICTASILYDVVLRARVSLETLRGVICAYFLIAFMFSYTFFLIEYIDPGTFSIRNEIIPTFPHPYYLSQMLYFSFVTLLTIGYGDIVAIKVGGQTATVLEGIIGQFYIAILVSRLVAIYSFYSDQRLLRNLEKDLDKRTK